MKKWKVYWNEDTFGTYLYGSKIHFIYSKKDIEYHNELMPPGTIIKEWYSKIHCNHTYRTKMPMIDGKCLPYSSQYDRL